MDILLRIVTGQRPLSYWWARCTSGVRQRDEMYTREWWSANAGPLYVEWPQFKKRVAVTTVLILGGMFGAFSERASPVNYSVQINALSDLGESPRHVNILRTNRSSGENWSRANVFVFFQVPYLFRVLVWRHNSFVTPRFGLTVSGKSEDDKRQSFMMIKLMGCREQIAVWFWRG